MNAYQSCATTDSGKRTAGKDKGGASVWKAQRSASAGDDYERQFLMVEDFILATRLATKVEHCIANGMWPHSNQVLFTTSVTSLYYEAPCFLLEFDRW